MLRFSNIYAILLLVSLICNVTEYILTTSDESILTHGFKSLPYVTSCWMGWGVWATIRFSDKSCCCYIALWCSLETFHYHDGTSISFKF